MHQHQKVPLETAFPERHRINTFTCLQTSLYIHLLSDSKTSFIMPYSWCILSGTKQSCISLLSWSNFIPLYQADGCCNFVECERQENVDCYYSSHTTSSKGNFQLQKSLSSALQVLSIDGCRRMRLNCRNPILLYHCHTNKKLPCGAKKFPENKPFVLVT